MFERNRVDFWLVKIVLFLTSLVTSEELTRLGAISACTL